jgi:hypothetical protein
MLSITVINVLIVFFILLIVSQIFLAVFNNYTIEGLTTIQPLSSSIPVVQDNQETQSSQQEYQPYNTNDPNNALILAQQNAGNIQILKQQLDGLMSLDQEVQDISGNVASLQTQVVGMVGAQQQYAQNMAPKTPPKISGAVNTSS